jgi:hypothetical protein
MLDSLRQQLADLWDKTTKQMLYVPIPAGQVDQAADYVSLEYGRHYLRLWLSSAYLAKQVQFLQTWYPAVHALVRFDLQGTPIDVPTVADASKAGLTKTATGDVIARNFVLTPLIPLNSGTVSLDAGLIAVEGANYLENFINTLSSFSDLLSVAQFSTALNIAGPLARGLQSLLSEGGIQLALHDGWGAGRVGGYWAAVRATESQLAGRQLSVDNDQLRISSPKSDDSATVPLEGFDHLLFRLEVTETGPVYEALTSISEPMKAALQALAVDEAKADGFYRSAVIAAHQAAELTTADRIRVKTQLSDDYQSLKQSLGYEGLAGGREYDLSNRMKLAKSVDQALTDGDPSWAELFGN